MNTLALVLIILAGLTLSFWRLLDRRADRQAMHELALSQPAQPVSFSAEMVAHLPEPVRRYFLYTIRLGTPLYTVARIRMKGRFGMGDRDKPGYLDFTATQVLAMPAGFVWQMRAKGGLMRLSGSDSHSWTRFWLMGILPVARQGGDPDHTRSAFGRYVAESVFWTPGALLPGPGISWESRDPDHARVTIDYRGLSQAVDLKLASDGQPTEVRFERWSNANPQKRHRLQPFGGYLSEFQTFGGFRLPTHVEAGNHFGTEQYFAFFVADVTAVEYPHD
ncbi:DUF6544 family protein [Bowmanella dokdonensis]|uniref:Uncharacterized protein n=1 Tax=Bowmanella dokdonensis TaxID=751969 RepID=A0A939DPZ1_9ALTE|nr:DUF6544 family protein [Bowmanella dokdonensis]MBN7826523.1 hypothetical protein [Bowmanella dokdonensis]